MNTSFNELDNIGISESLLKVKLSKRSREFKRIVDSFESIDSLKESTILNDISKKINSNIIEFYNNTQGNHPSVLETFCELTEMDISLLDEDYIDDTGGVFGYLPIAINNICPEIRKLCQIPMEGVGSMAFLFEDIDKDLYYFNDDHFLDLFKEDKQEEFSYEHQLATFLLEIQCPEISKYIKYIFDDKYLLEAMFNTIGTIFVCECIGLFFYDGNPVFLLSTPLEKLEHLNVYLYYQRIASDIFLAIIELRLIRYYIKNNKTKKYIRFIKHHPQKYLKL